MRDILGAARIRARRGGDVGPGDLGLEIEDSARETAKRRRRCLEWMAHASRTEARPGAPGCLATIADSGDLFTRHSRGRLLADADPSDERGVSRGSGGR